MSIGFKVLLTLSPPPSSSRFLPFFSSVSSVTRTSSSHSSSFLSRLKLTNAPGNVYLMFAHRVAFMVEKERETSIEGGGASEGKKSKADTVNEGEGWLNFDGRRGKGVKKRDKMRNFLRGSFKTQLM